jgi:hypothetical protein
MASSQDSDRKEIDMRLPTDPGAYVTRVVDVDGMPVPVQAIIVVRPELTLLSTMICPAQCAVEWLGTDQCEISDVMHETVLN